MTTTILECLCGHTEEAKTLGEARAMMKKHVAMHHRKVLKNLKNRII